MRSPFIWKKKSQIPLEPPKAKKVLIIRFSSIGDIVLTSPIIRTIKQQIPNVQLHYLTKSNFQFIIQANPSIDKCHYLDNNWEPLIQELKKQNFDFIIDLHKNLRTKRIINTLGIPHYSFNKLNIRKWLKVNFKWNTMPDKSIVTRYFEGLKRLGIKNDGKGLDYFIPENDFTQKDDIPMSHWMGYVACVIGGTYATKQFPANQWQKLIAASPYPIILLGGKEDIKLAQEIIQNNDPKVYNACGKFNFNESADLIRLSNVVITSDTGLMHVAAAFKKPIISLWGNTTPDLGMFPYYGFNNLTSNIAFQSVLINEMPKCKPCSKIGYNQCPKQHFNCMQHVSINKIVLHLNRLWKNE